MTKACKMAKVSDEVILERERQNRKWGEQNHNPIEWLAILGEEVGESNKAALEAHFKGYEREGNYSDYREELIQVAAVAIAAVESLDRGHIDKEGCALYVDYKKSCQALKDHELSKKGIDPRT